MADDTKPTTTSATSVTSVISEPEPKPGPEPTPDELEKAVIQAEIEAGKTILAANNKVARAKAALAKATDIDTGSGYGVKTWAGVSILQCFYCPLDVPANEEDRMIEHMTSHPEPRGEVKYDNLGNALD